MTKHDLDAAYARLLAILGAGLAATAALPVLIISAVIR